MYIFRLAHRYALKMQYRVLFLVAGCFFCGGASFGQNQLIETKRLDVEDGLSHNSVNAVYQDSQGLMWLATQYGLNLYDGHTFEWITKKEYGLSSDQIHKILADKDGMLWLIEFEAYQGVYTILHIDILDPETKAVKTFDAYFEGKTQVKELGIQYFIQTQEEEILLLDAGGKYWKYTGGGTFQSQHVPTNFRLINISTDKKLLGIIDNQITMLDAAGTVLFQQEKNRPYLLDFLHQTPNEQIVFGTFDGKNHHLNHWDYQNEMIYSIDLGLKEFSPDWAIDHEGKTWVYGDKDLFILDEQIRPILCQPP